MSIVVVGSVAYDTVETQNGAVEDALGGSALYFSLAARFFSPVSLVATVGSDFKAEHERVFAERNIDVRGLERREGLTFRWHGRYHEDMNKRDTVSVDLNVFSDFTPDLLPDQRRADYLFLGNINPELQERVLAQMMSPKLVGADTMNLWIETARAPLMRTLSKIQLLMLNDEEARMLTGEHNLVKAGKAILKMGPRSVLVKRGEYGVLQFSQGTMFAVPAYPLEEVVDPTGAGDTFAGAVMGYLARGGRVNEGSLRNAVVYGTVLASFVVERFSADRLLSLTWEEIDRRYRAFIELTACNHPKWTSP